jgi:phage tail P2-like protein
MINELLPSNAAPQEIALSGAAARIGDVPVPLRDLYQPAATPLAALPALAWSYSLDEWNTDWSESQKRQAVADSLYVHRHKGTAGAVKRALSALGLDVQVQEWFQQTPAAAPFTFRLLLTADQFGFDQAALQRLLYVVSSTKNLRSHLSDVVPRVVTTAGPQVAAVSHVGTEITTGFGYSLVADGSVAGDGQYRANGIKVKMN